MLLARIAVAFIVAMSSTLASAELIRHETNGIVTTEDTATGLEWLSLRHTENRAVDDYLSRTDPGEEFYGWTISTEAQQFELYESAGITPSLSSLWIVDQASIDLLVNSGWLHFHPANNLSGLQSMGAIHSTKDPGTVDYFWNGTRVYQDEISTSPGPPRDPPHISITNLGVFGWDAYDEVAIGLVRTVPTETPSGDYDGDGDVDGRDFLEWQKNFGTSGEDLPTDGNGDGTVDGTDLVVWHQGFGGGSQSGVVIGVPEPSSLDLCSLLGATCLVMRYRR